MEKLSEEVRMVEVMLVISGFDTPDPGAVTPIGGGDTCISCCLTLRVGYEVPSSVKLTKPSSFGIRGECREKTFLETSGYISLNTMFNLVRLLRML